jgi:general secretion pathway protein E
MPPERERASTYTLSQQVRAILNQRLIKTLCQSCAHRTSAGEVLPAEDIELLGIEERTGVRTQNLSGCDLCQRTGIMGRTLLLDGLIITTPIGHRDGIFKALLGNVNDVVQEDGVIFYSRREGIVDLLKNGLIDPRSAVHHLDD